MRLAGFLLIWLCSTWVFAQWEKKEGTIPILGISDPKNQVEPQVEFRFPPKHREPSSILDTVIEDWVGAEKTQLDSPVVTDAFDANMFNGFYPPDNTMAINENGILVSCANSSLWVFNSSGAVLRSTSLLSLIGQSPGGHYFYDPRVVYSPTHQMFCLIVLYGSTPSNTYIYMLFSKTPQSGNWKVYSLPGDPYNSGLWADYPSVAIWGEDLAISFNMFTVNNEFSKAMIMQVGLQEADAGTPLKYRTYRDLTGNPFTPVPVEIQSGNTYDAPFYLVSTQSGGGSNIYIFTVSSSIYQTAGEVKYRSFPIRRYYFPGNAKQPNGRGIDLGGCRVKKAFLSGGIIQFIYGEKSIYGQGGLRLVRVDIDKDIHHETSISIPGTHLAFPTLVPYTTDIFRKSCVIGYLSVSSKQFPGMGAIWVGENLEISKPALLRQGSAVVNLNTDTFERWGDYTTMVSTPGKDSADVWMAGCYANSSGQWRTRIVHFFPPSISPSPIITQNTFYVTNSGHEGPWDVVCDRVESGHLRFQLSSLDGKWMKTFGSGTVLRNEKVSVTLYPGDLAPGIYFITLIDGDMPIQTHRLTILER